MMYCTLTFIALHFGCQWRLQVSKKESKKKKKGSKKRKVCPWIKWTWKKTGHELNWVLFATKYMNMIHSNLYVLWLVVNLLKYTSRHPWKAVFLPSLLICERWKDTCWREEGKLKFFAVEIGISPFRMVNINMHMGYFLLNKWRRIDLKHLSLTKALLYWGPRLAESKTTSFRSC